ncbi:hypothetical protein HZS_2815 [Henneguya salminicola]|nr:hypothetical protein HZS_2815 [Henneguya salminicola]
MSESEITPSSLENILLNSLSNHIKSLQTVYHEIIVDDYNKNYKIIEEKCEILRSNAEFCMKCDSTEKREFEQILLKILAKDNWETSDFIEFKDKDSIIWNETYLKNIDNYFDEKILLMRNSFQNFNKNLKFIVSENIQNLKFYTQRYYKLINDENDVP